MIRASMFGDTASERWTCRCLECAEGNLCKDEVAVLQNYAQSVFGHCFWLHKVLSQYIQLHRTSICEQHVAGHAGWMTFALFDIAYTATLSIEDL